MAEPIMATAIRSSFGEVDGQPVERITLVNANGVSASVITLGATLQSVMLFGRDGKPVDVAAGYATAEEYRAGSAYFGASVGRYANRIARGRFTLDGREHQITINNGENALHGGVSGFDARHWSIVSTESGATAKVMLRLISPDGDQGFPGRLTVDATYALDEAAVLTIEFRATTDAPTIVNLTNHAYWNLAGEGSSDGAMRHLLTIDGGAFLPTDAGLIPTGERRAVADSAFDFRQPHMIGERVRDASDAQIVAGKGYDHNWIVTDDVTPEQHRMARLVDPASGRGFELWSNQPGLQFYSGNFLDAGFAGKAGRLYRQGDAIALEPQRFPDTPNQPTFGSARLDPGETYLAVMSYRFFVEPS